jgi:hypothetical protein
VVADFWTAVLRIAAAITAMAKETQHAARKLRIGTLQIAVVLRYGPRIWPPGPAVSTSPQRSKLYDLCHLGIGRASAMQFSEPVLTSERADEMLEVSRFDRTEVRESFKSLR